MKKARLKTLQGAWFFFDQIVGARGNHFFWAVRVFFLYPAQKRSKEWTVALEELLEFTDVAGLKAGTRAIK